MANQFLGRGWQFPVRFDPHTREAAMVEGVPDIEESLHILLSTYPGERVMLPAYGCPVRRTVFESITESSLTALKELVRKAVLFFEPRIVLEQLHAELVDPLNGKLELRLLYRIRSTNTRHNLVYPLYLDQATNPVVRF